MGSLCSLRAAAVNGYEYSAAYYSRGRAQALQGNHDRGLEDLKKAAKLGYEDAVNFLKARGSTGRKGTDLQPAFSYCGGYSFPFSPKPVRIAEKIRSLFYA
jgi:hypothetical protein